MTHQPLLTGSSRPVVFLGGGGHALVCADAALGARADIVGFYDDNEQAPLASMAPWLGTLGHIDHDTLRGCAAILAVGDITLRRTLLGRIDSVVYTTIKHSSAVRSSRADIGRGTLLAPGSIVNGRAVIAKHAIINTGAIVEHDCIIGENTHIAPGAVLGGSVEIGHDTLVGLGARVLPNIKIGNHARVGAGAVVIENVPDNTTVAGVPAKVI